MGEAMAHSGSGTHRCAYQGLAGAQRISSALVGSGASHPARIMSGGHLLLSQLDPAQDVVAAPDQLAGYCEGGPSRAGAAVGRRPEVAVRAVVATAVLGCLDRRPTEQGRTLFG